jgi:hypothetical protein
VTTNAVVSVAWQQVCLGAHHAGARCDVHIDGDLLRIFIGDELVKTAARTNRDEVRNKRAFRTRQQACVVSNTKAVRCPHVTGNWASGVRTVIQRYSTASYLRRAGEANSAAYWLRNGAMSAHRCRTDENPATGGQRRPVHHAAAVETR